MPRARQKRDLTGELPLVVLVSASALIGAVFGARGAVLMTRAQGEWQVSIRLEEHRATEIDLEVQSVFQDEAPVAYQVAKARQLSYAYLFAAADHRGTVAHALEVESQTQDAVQQREGTGDALVDPKYALPLTTGGGYSVALRLKDVLQGAPQILAIDPAAAARRADHESRKAVLQILATIPLGVTFLLGAAARAVPARRRVIVPIGFMVLVLGSVFGLIVLVGSL